MEKIRMTLCIGVLQLVCGVEEFIDQNWEKRGGENESYKKKGAKGHKKE